MELLKKIFKVGQKFIAKELIWAISVIVLSIPLGLLLVGTFDFFNDDFLINNPHINYPGINLFLLMYFTSAIGLYTARLIRNAIKTTMLK